MRLDELLKYPIILIVLLVLIILLPKIFSLLFRKI